MITIQFRLLAVLFGVMILACPAGCQQVRQWVKTPQQSSGGRTTPLDSSLLSQKKRPTQKDKPDAAFAAARSLEQSSQLEQAAKAYLELTKDHPGYAPAHHRLAVVQMQLGKGPDADGAFEKALQLDPANSELLCDFGYALYLKGDLVGAEANYRQALKKQPDSPRALNQLGLVLAQTDRHSEALEHFRAAGCKSSEAHMNVAYALMRNQKFDLANHHLALAKSKTSHSSQLEGRVIELQKVAGDLAKADLAPTATQTAQTTTPSAELQAEPQAAALVKLPEHLTPAPSKPTATKVQGPISPASYVVPPVMVQISEKETVEAK
jgi:Tfp pilus assembly protein PilF